MDEGDIAAATVRGTLRRPPTGGRSRVSAATTLAPPLPTDPEADDDVLSNVKTGVDAESASTLLLRRRHALAHASGQLATTRNVFASTLRTLEGQEALFKTKRRDFDESMVTYKEVVEDAEAKRRRAGERLVNETSGLAILDSEVDGAGRQLGELHAEIAGDQKEIGKLTRFAGYFERFVVAAATGKASEEEGTEGKLVSTENFHGPANVLVRFAQAKATNQDLFEQVRVGVRHGV